MIRFDHLPVLATGMLCAECGTEWQQSNRCPTCGPGANVCRLTVHDGGEYAAWAWDEFADDIARRFAAAREAA